MPTPIADPLGRLRLASLKISPRRMNQLDNRKRKQLSPPPLFLCFCLSPFFYLVILEKKKKAPAYLESRAGWGGSCAGEWQALHAETRLCHLPGHRARTGRPQTRGGRGELLLPVPSPGRAPAGHQHKGPVAAAVPRSSFRTGPSRLRDARPLARSSKGRGPTLRPVPRPRPQSLLYSCSRSAAAGGVRRVTR